MSSFAGSANTAPSSEHEDNDERNAEREEEASRGPLSTNENHITSEPPVNEEGTTLESNEEATREVSQEKSDVHEEGTNEKSQNVELSNPPRTEHRQTKMAGASCSNDAPSSPARKEHNLGINNNNHTPGAEGDHHPFASSVPKDRASTTTASGTNDEVVWVPGSLVVVQEDQIPTAVAIDENQEDHRPTTLQEFLPPPTQGHDDHPSQGGAAASPAPEMHPGIQIMSVVMDEGSSGNRQNRAVVPLVNADPIDRTQQDADVKMSTLFRSRKLYILVCLVILLTMMFTWGLESFVLWAIDDDESVNVNITIEETGSTMESFVHEVLQIVDPVALTNSSSPQFRALEWLFMDMEYVRNLPNFRRVQRYALATLCFSMMQFETAEEAQDGIGWLSTRDHNMDNIHECEWPTSFPKSVVCRDERFLILHFQGEAWNLIGSIPPEVALLTDLVSINLSNNYLMGSIPTHVGMMSKLESLIVEDTELTGPIPTEIGKLQALTKLLLTHNQLSSSLPSEIGQMNHLNSLDVHNNQLTGSIPEEFQFLPSSRFYGLDLHSNALSGTIPTGLGQLVEIRWLDLSQTNLNGTIPTELGLMQYMNGLNLYSIPNLSGEIPTELESMTTIDILYLHNTSLSGRVPKGICQVYQEEQLSFFMISCSLVDCSCHCPCVEDDGAFVLEDETMAEPVPDDERTQQGDSDYHDVPSGGIVEDTIESETVSSTRMIQPSWLLVVGLGMLVLVT